MRNVPVKIQALSDPLDNLAPNSARHIALSEAELGVKGGRMSPDERRAIVESMFKQCRELLETRGADYSRNEPDVLSNFKRCAQDLDMRAVEIAWVYARKHLDSIVSYIKTGTSSEPIESRVADAINYLLIIYCLLREESNEVRS